MPLKEATLNHLKPPFTPLSLSLSLSLWWGTNTVCFSSLGKQRGDSFAQELDRRLLDHLEKRSLIG